MPRASSTKDGETDVDAHADIESVNHSWRRPCCNFGHFETIFESYTQPSNAEAIGANIVVSIVLLILIL